MCFLHSHCQQFKSSDVCWILFMFNVIFFVSLLQIFWKCFFLICKIKRKTSWITALQSYCEYKTIGHVWMWESDYKESWVPKNWCFWTVMLEKTLESPLNCKEIQPVHTKGDQSWIFIGRTDVEAETPILWPPDVKSWLIWKDWCWERLKVGGEGDDRGWDGWMASLTHRTWVWVNSGSWWWTGKTGVLQSMGSQRVGHDSTTELNMYNAYDIYIYTHNRRYIENYIELFRLQLFAWASLVTQMVENLSA